VEWKLWLKDIHLNKGEEQNERITALFPSGYFGLSSDIKVKTVLKVKSNIHG
jgi:hypothetical protein